MTDLKDPANKELRETLSNAVTVITHRSSSGAGYYEKEVLTVWSPELGKFFYTDWYDDMSPDLSYRDSGYTADEVPATPELIAARDAILAKRR